MTRKGLTSLYRDGKGTSPYLHTINTHSPTALTKDRVTGGKQRKLYLIIVWHDTGAFRLKSPEPG